MKPLSEQLEELSERAKKSEDFVAAARAKNRTYIAEEREELKKSIATGKAQLNAAASATTDKARSSWDDVRGSIEARAAKLRAEREERHAEHDLKKAEHRADDAEQDAVYAIGFALQMLDEAEYAVADAVLARIDADELAASDAV